MARRNRKIKLKPILFIACEGTSSEYQYFESWAQSDEALSVFERVDVYPDENEDNPKTTPFQLYEIAKLIIDNGSADKVWLVFDKDNHPRLAETFANSKLCGINIGFSSRSFEEWVLMHFEKNFTTFNATECKDVNGKPINCGSVNMPNCDPVNCLAGYIRRQNLIADYSKKKTFDLFTVIKKQTEIAVVNAAWLRFHASASLNQQQPPLHTLNPYTDIDQLILQLHGKTDIIEWGASGNNIVLSNWIINASIIKRRLVVRISHSNLHSQVLNLHFLNSAFFLTDDQLNHSSCNMISQKYLVNNNGSTNQLLYPHDILEFTFELINKPYFLFKLPSKKAKIFVEL